MIVKYVKNLEFMKNMVGRFITRVQNDLGGDLLEVLNLFNKSFDKANRRIEEAINEMIWALDECEKILNRELKRRMVQNESKTLIESKFKLGDGE